MSAQHIGAAMLLLAAFAYAARAVFAFTPVRPSANATLVMCLCVALGLSMLVVGEILA